jgi:hypothetical protein
MSSGMKYLVIDTNGIEEAILFPCWWQHINMRDKMRIPQENVVAAGFFKRNDDGKLYCHGSSVILKKNSRPEEDLALILKHLSFTI